MRILSVSFVVGALSAILNAQTTYQAWDMFPGATSFTTRGSMGGGPGSIYQGVHANTNRGVMEVRGGSCRIARLSAVIQDQNCGTKEKYGYIVRSGSDVTGPRADSAAVLGRLSGLSFPNGPNNPCAFIVTSTLATNSRITVPNASHWSYGLEFTPNPGWTRDGHSVHATSGQGTRNPHNSHSRQHDQAWQLVGTATAASHPARKLAPRITVHVADSAVLKLRCGGRPGYGGTFPVASTSTAPLRWDARVDGGTNAAGLPTLVALSRIRHGGVPVGVSANIYLGAPCIVFSGPKADLKGIAIIPLEPFVPAASAGTGIFHLQGGITTGAGISLTNSQTVIP
jgi:hypothetical protein